MPKVSIILPTYNSITYLAETIESVFRQTFTDFELVVVDDGSTDQTVTWLQQIRDPRLRVICQTNQGVCVARNTGITNAQGEYLAFLDHDDLWQPTKLEQQVDCLDRQPEVGLVHTWMAFIDQDGRSTGRVMSSQAAGEVWQRLLEKNEVASASVMVRRQCFEVAGLFSPARDIYTLEDWEMWLRIAPHYRFAVLPEPLLLWRHHLNSGSKNWRAMERAYQIVIESAYAVAPAEWQWLKTRSYGHAKLCLAWRALQSRDRDVSKAQEFQQQAVQHYPALRRSREYWRLSLAIALMRWLGAEGYQQILDRLYTLRRQLYRIPNRIPNQAASVLPKVEFAIKTDT